MERLRLDTEYMSETELADTLSKIDLTSEQSPPHGINQLYNLVEKTALSLEVPDTRIIRGSPIVTISDHYDQLLFPMYAGVRSPINSRYINDSLMLRGHTACMASNGLKEFAQEEGDEVLLLCPGICFRSKNSDKMHSSTIHQVDVWYANKKSQTGVEINIELARSIATEIARNLIPDGEFSLAPIPNISKSHPYLSGGNKLKVLYDGSSLTLMEFGLISPETFTINGLPQDASGLAIGIILERAMMIRKRLDDVRLISSTTPGIYEQMANLDEFQAQEKLFTYTRKISIAVSEQKLHSLEASIRDYIKSELGFQSNIAIEGITSVHNLPQSAVERYGISEGQVNAVISIELNFDDAKQRDIVNDLRDKIYLKFHEGSNSHLIAS